MDHDITLAKLKEYDGSVCSLVNGIATFYGTLHFNEERGPCILVNDSEELFDNAGEENEKPYACKPGFVPLDIDDCITIIHSGEKAIDKEKSHRLIIIDDPEYDPFELSY